MSHSLVPSAASQEVWGSDASYTLGQWLVRLLAVVAALAFTAGAAVGW